MQIHKKLLKDPLYRPSITEVEGLDFIRKNDLVIYSPGISTDGFAEIGMALNNPLRKIVATTIDTEGIKETAKLVKKYDVEKQVSLKLEDVSNTLPYNAETFDFVYARLVLHYLPKKDLQHALKELYRVSKKDARLFIVVRSFDWESEVENKTIDSETRVVTYPYFDKNGKFERLVKRNLQTVKSISEYVNAAGFKIESVTEVEETIYDGYIRIIANSKPSKLIELKASK